MNWYETQKYLNELPELSKKIIDEVNNTSTGQVVVDTYDVPFTVGETSQIILSYVEYAYKNKSVITDYTDPGFLSNPYYRYIVQNLTGSLDYTYSKKGLRDRIWNILAVLSKIGGKWYNPGMFVSPDVIPLQADNKIGKIVFSIAAAAGITKLLKMW